MFEGYWTWHDSTGSHRIRYQRSGDAGPPLLCVHGFGGNADQWRHQLRALGAAGCRVWAVDLLGYGYSDKPDPRARPPNEIYNFHTWSRQLLDFRSAHIGEPAFVITNSVGGITGLQAALDAPSQVRGVQVMNVSLRMLHASKQPAWQRPAVATLQRCLRETALGPWFFSQIATRNGVRSVLRQCYARPEAVTDELVDIILNPGLQAGAVDVFLDFLSYSSGPLPEQQLAEVAVPVSVLWGEEDPWEKLEWGRAFAPGPRFPAIEEFVPLPGVGHCPQCEAPELVNPLILAFVQRHAA